MLTRRMLVLTFTLAVLLILPAQSFAGQIFDFVYTIPAPNPGYAPVSGQGTLVTGDFDSGLGGYQIQDISGTRTVDGTVMQITGLLPVGAFGSNSNILYYPSFPLLDDFGLSFTVDSDSLSDDGLGNVNLYFDSFFSSSNNTPTAYTENASFLYYGDFQVTPRADTQDAASPEPGTYVLGLAGCICVAVGLRRHRSN